eukprot:TRINITY_DN20394_c0_g1_i4.p1 TRINITY_DN20394_c0_g1~~TRINITY_DN20394_c0_g1_i4.p1  ORF type:complete len:152 (-),score=18.86 TRINITY_DN20394_c0_g1_i4:5-460(-)
MGRRKHFRADRKKKRRFCGNQYKKTSDFVETSDNENAEKSCDRGSVDITDTCDRNENNPIPTASSSKLGNANTQPGEDDMNFDKDPELTGFRFVDCELMIEFIQSLLCPKCRQPLGQNKRLSYVVEHKSTLASKFDFHCQCQHTLSPCTLR